MSDNGIALAMSQIGTLELLEHDGQGTNRAKSERSEYP